MKTVTVDTRLPPPTNDVAAHQLAAYLAGYLCDKSSGALYGQWDEGKRRGTWFYSTDAAAIFTAPPVDEILFEEDQRWRFRSVVFRFGSMASETPIKPGGDYSRAVIFQAGHCPSTDGTSRGRQRSRPWPR